MTNEADVKSWYNQKHRSQGKQAWRPLEAYPVILDCLNVQADEKILDVGCGTGSLLRAAEQIGLKTYGVDISEQGIKIAKQNSPDSHLSVGKGEDLKFADEVFDYVTCLGALEHFLDMEEGLREMIRVSKKDARFCIMVPNIDYFLWKIKGSVGTEQQEINENLRTLEEWKNIFTNNGLEVVEIHKDEWRVKQIEILSSFNPIEILTKILYKIAWISLPLRYTYQFIFVLKKRPF